MNKTINYILGLLKKISFYLLIAYSVLVGIQVISRYFFNSPTTWTELVARYLFVWSIMLYMPVLYNDKGNPAFDILFKKLEPNVQRVLNILMNFIIMFCAVCLLLWGIKYCNLMSNKYIKGLGTGLKLSMNLVYSAIPAGGFFLLLTSLKELVFSIKRLEEGDN